MLEIHTLEQLESAKIAEAQRYGTTVENLESSGFVFDSETCGNCHWFALIHGWTWMSLEWFREQQKKLDEKLSKIGKSHGLDS